MKNLVMKEQELKRFVQLSEREQLMALRTSLKGLSEKDAEKRLEEYGYNQIDAEKPTPVWKLFLHGLLDPFVLVLALLMIISLITKDYEAAIVMGVMIVASASISFVQAYRSQKASVALKEMIENTATVLRGDKELEIPMDEVVPGDILYIATGDMIPADALLIWSKDLFVNQAPLTGESMPVEKNAQSAVSIEAITSAVEMEQLIFMGTDVLSGQGKAIILKTGQATFFGDIAKSVRQKRTATTFDLGLLRVSKFLLRMVMGLFPLVFVLNGLTKGDWGAAFFFAVAVAVGLTPEMLPMIVTSNLAKGAMTLSREKVIVKELPSIQNLGSMDILCTDKTGTITEDRVVLVEHLNPIGENNQNVLEIAFINSAYQTGWKNLMDLAVINYYEERSEVLPTDIVKIDEIPFDFSRRRLTVVVDRDGSQLMITKGAVEEMEEVCQFVEINGQRLVLTDDLREQMRAINRELNARGMRVLAVAIKENAHREAIYSVADEAGMTLMGFVGFLDPAKASAKTAISSLHQHGVTVKVLTGDNEIVAAKVCQDVGIDARRFLLGNEIETLSDEQLSQEVEQVHLFAKLNPMQKARLIRILQANEHTVGFMGDGINDAPALRAADVGISVDTAADITKDASSIILLEKSLDVLETGVLEGRKVFSNMMKYIKITISSNFGNVFSILVASVFLPFLPMLSLQLLVQNLIYDLAQLAIPWDAVDEEEVQQPVKWRVRGLLKFTLALGPVSSVFDILTFLLMWYVFDANTAGNQSLFQTGWFVVGLVTQTLVVHLVRTRRLSFVESVASMPVLFASGLAIVAGLVIVLTPLGTAVDFVSLPASYWCWFVVLVGGYLIVVEVVKRIYIKVTEEWI